jgi:hypothetical protein
VYVGVPLGILLAIALGVIAWLVLQNRNLKKRKTGHPYHNEVNAVVDNKQMGYTHSHVNELGTRPEELPNGDYLRAELESGKWDDPHEKWCGRARRFIIRAIKNDNMVGLFVLYDIWRGIRSR